MISSEFKRVWILEHGRGTPLAVNARICIIRRNAARESRRLCCPLFIKGETMYPGTTIGLRVSLFANTVAVYKYFHSFIMPAFVSYFRLLGEQLADRSPTSRCVAFSFSLFSFFFASWTTWLLMLRSIWSVWTIVPAGNVIITSRLKIFRMLFAHDTIETFGMYYYGCRSYEKLRCSREVILKKNLHVCGFW